MNETVLKTIPLSLAYELLHTFPQDLVPSGQKKQMAWRQISFQELQEYKLIY